MTITALITSGRLPSHKISSSIYHHAPALTSLLLASTTSPTRTPHCVQNQHARSFFWSRREWTSYLDTGLQKHIQRQHRILKHKYAKALRRSALWDRSASHDQHHLTGWRLNSSWRMGSGKNADEDNTGLKSADGAKKPSDESEKWKGDWGMSYEARKEMFVKSFEEFKKRIDADPYNAIFGRNLQKLCYHPVRDGWPGSRWLIRSRYSGMIDASDPLEMKRSRNGMEDWDSAFWEIPPRRPEPKKVSVDKDSKSTLTADNVAPTAAKPIPEHTSVDSTLEEFEFDPISMRKVPKKLSNTASAERSTLLSPEKRADIPVKTFKGYRAQFDQLRPPTIIEPMGSKSSNNNDSKYMNQRNEERVKNLKTAEQAVDTEQLEKAVASSTSSANWLAKEGFGATPPQSFGDFRFARKSPLEKASVESTDQTTMNKLEASIDRIKSNSRASGDFLQPPSQTTEWTAIGAEKDQAKPLLYKELDSKVEDLDLLRASDIRSSPKFTRPTKQDIGKEKLTRRQNLENSYSKLREEQRSVAEEEQFEPEADPRARVYDLRKHKASEKGRDEALKDGQSSKEVFRQRLITFQDVFANLVRSSVDMMKLDIEVNETSKQVKLDRQLSKEVAVQKAAMVRAEIKNPAKVIKDPQPSYFFQTNMTSDGSKKLTGFARSVAEHERKAKEIKETEKEKERALVREIRSIYESTYGVLTSRHRQPAIPPQSSGAVEAPVNESVQEYNDTAKGASSPFERMGLADKKLSTTKPPSPGPSAVADVQSYTTPPEVEAQILKELKKEREQRLAQIEESTKSNAQYEAKYQQMKDKHEKDVVLFKEELEGEKKNSKRMLEKTRRASEENQTLHEKHQKFLLHDLQETRTQLAQAKTKLEKLSTSINQPKVEPSSSPVAESTPVVSASSPAPATYKVLAYDSSTLSITTASTTSSILSPQESPLSPAEALSRLNNAAKFLPHFSALQNAGYEIVSGTGDLLIFKKVRDNIDDTRDAEALEEKADLADRMAASFQYPVEQEIQSQRPKNEASPSTRLPSTASKISVKRTEPVFSGQNTSSANTHSSASENNSAQSQLGSKSKRSKTSFVIWGALWTGASAVAFSVVRDFFKAGEKEKRKVDWLGGTRNQR